MFFIILAIIIAILLVAVFVSPSHKDSDSNIDWWTIGMIADLHNKARMKDKK